MATTEPKAAAGTNTLDVVCPDLAKHISPNSPLSPSEVLPNTQETLLWICEKCNKEFEGVGVIMARRYKRGKQVKCNNCRPVFVMLQEGVNDLAAEHPEIAIEWDYSKNEKSPQEYLPHSGELAYWKCPKCGMSYLARIADRVGNKKRKGTQCPYCANNHAKVHKGFNDLQSQYPLIAAEYDTEANEKAPDTIFAHSSITAVWYCKRCGKRWQTTVHSRTRHKDAPHCIGSDKNYE